MQRLLRGKTVRAFECEFQGRGHGFEQPVVAHLEGRCFEARGVRLSKRASSSLGGVFLRV
jgi:hypothetical protein